MPVHAGAIAAGHRQTAEAARAVLMEGGNAFDAVLAALMAACVAEPVLASLGGGGFLTAKTADGRVETFDFFAETPLAPADPDRLDFHPILADFGPAQQKFHIGIGAAATPGAVAGLFAVHAALGRMPLPEIARPAIELAASGIALNAFQAYLLGVVGPIYAATAESRALFCRSGADGALRLLGEGDVYRPDGFADFLDNLMRDGPELFYAGELAGALENLDGAAIGAADLAAYRVARRVPLRIDAAGAHVYLNPPPAIGGALVAAMLGEIARHGRTDAPAVIAAMRRCNAVRTQCGIDRDPEGGALRLAELLGHPPSYRGTTHIGVADGQGNLAALTVSNGEGCGHILPGTGVMLNNMMGEEDLNACGLLAWPPGRRLSSMMTPGVARAADGTWTAFGSGGSNRIRSAVAQVVAALAFDGASPRDAVERPRLHLENGCLNAEPGFDPEVLDVLCEAGETVRAWPARNMFFGGAHVVARDADGRFDGAGDPRRDGIFLTV